MNRVRGVPCYLRTSRTRRVIGLVLDRICQKSPNDFLDLQKLVRKIVPITQPQQKDGTRAEWKADIPAANDPTTWRRGIDRSPGILFLAEDFGTESNVVATVAHEFGH